MIRVGLGEPLILLHGVTGGPSHWREVTPLVAPRHDTLLLPALGHAGGAMPAHRPITIVDVADDLERQLDHLELDTVHIAGNSMGGWLAIELARRGRARSVCALSPAGMWAHGSGEAERVLAVLHTAMREAALGRPLRGLLRLKAVRRHGMRIGAEHGERLTPEHIRAIGEEGAVCDVMDEIIATEDETQPLDPLPCPVTVAWSQHDRVLPYDPHALVAQRLLPAARHIVLDDVGHVPMFDDPALVARTILETTGAA